jgi:hypothetical protein
MKNLLAILLFVLLLTDEAFSQNKNENQSQNTLQEIMAGKCSRNELQNSSFSSYFYESYSVYKTKADIIENIRQVIYAKRITIVLGAWCEDSQEQVPRFIKILDQIDYNTSMIDFFCVDRNKTAGQTDISDLDIKKVPTFIVFDHHMEMGRIIETPELSLEEDLLTILQNL